MKYYSNKIFCFFISLYIIVALGILFSWRIVSPFVCWSLSGNECINTETKFNIFWGIIPLLFIVLSGIVVTLQQKGYRRLGYFMISLIMTSFFYVPYLYQFLHFGFSEPIPQGFIISFVAIILILVVIIPFYVLGRLIKEDFFNKRIIRR